MNKLSIRRERNCREVGRNVPQREETEDTLCLSSSGAQERLWVSDITRGSCSVWMVLKAMGLDQATQEEEREERRMGREERTGYPRAKH